MIEKIKKYKWKERLICLAIAYEIFLVTYMITQIIANPSSYLIHWAARQMLVPLVLYTFLVLIFNWKIVAIGFPIGHILGLIVGNIFGGYSLNPGGFKDPNHWGYYLETSIITTLFAIALEIVYRVKRRSKVKLCKDELTK